MRNNHICDDDKVYQPILLDCDTRHFFLILCVSFIIMMTIKIRITITTVMTTNFNSRSHNSCFDVYDNNIHKVRIVFCSIRC
jgi:hypothetical protein